MHVRQMVTQFHTEHVLEIKGARSYNYHLRGVVDAVCIGWTCSRVPLSSQLWESSAGYKKLVLLEVQ